MLKVCRGSEKCWNWCEHEHARHQYLCANACYYRWLNLAATELRVLPEARASPPLTRASTTTVVGLRFSSSRAEASLSTVPPWLLTGVARGRAVRACAREVSVAWVCSRVVLLVARGASSRLRRKGSRGHSSRIGVRVASRSCRFWTHWVRVWPAMWTCTNWILLRVYVLYLKSLPAKQMGVVGIFFMILHEVPTVHPSRINRIVVRFALRCCFLNILSSRLAWNMNKYKLK